MKQLFLVFGFLFVGAFGYGQYAASACGSSTCAAELNSKPAVQTSSSNASGNCTAGKDFWFNTTAGTMQFCQTTNVWSLATISAILPLQRTGNGTQFANAGANKIAMWAFYVYTPTAITNVAFDISVLDATATNYYDIGIYGPNCAAGASCGLLADIGANQAFTSTSNVTAKALVPTGPILLLPGLYYLATTGMATTAQLTNAGSPTRLPVTGGAQCYGTGSTGGILPSTVTMSAAGSCITNAAPPSAIFY